MKKKILLFISALALVMTGAFASTSLAAVDFADIPEGTSESRILDIISELGIMVGIDEEGVRNFKPNQAVTRAEFVTAINNAINNRANVSVDDSLLDDSGFDWKAFYMSDGRSELELMMPAGMGEDGESTVKRLFSDVDESHWAYENIRDVMITGSIKGYGDGTFRPENIVSYNEAVKVILAVCGYDPYAQSNGGWPDGYIKLATRFNLNRGISATGDMPMSRMDVATLIYNAFTLELAPNEIDDNDDNKNFLNDIIDVEIAEGVLSSTDITSIYGNGEEDECTAVVDGVEFTFDTESDIRDYIGRDVRAYLKELEDGTYTLKFFEEVKGDDITVIDIALFEEFEDNQFYYYKNAESSSTKRTKIRNGSVVIYNGKYVDEYDSTTFENLNQGTITLIEKDDLEFDIVVVENFDSGYTDSGYQEKSKGITDVLKSGGTAAAMIEFEAEEGEKAVIYRLYDSEGNSIDLSKIGKGAINYYVNDNYVKLYYTSNEVSGTVTGQSTDDGKTYMTIKDIEYPLASSLASYIDGVSKRGVEVKASIDKYGELVWLSETINTDGYVYFIKVKQDLENDCMYLYYYDIDNQTVKERMSTTSEIRYIDENGATSKLSYSVLYEDMQYYDGLLKLTFNDEGKISKIEEPLKKGVDKSGTLKKVFETVLVADETHPYTINTHPYVSNTFGGTYYCNSATVVLQVPGDREYYDGYGIISYNKIGYYNPTQIYTLDETSPYAKLAVTFPNTSSTGNIYSTDMPTYMVLSMTDGIDEDGDFADVATLIDISTGVTKTVYAKEDEDGKSVFSDAMDSRGSINATEKYSVQRGDIILMPVDSVTDEPIEVKAIYSARGVNPAWCLDDYTNRPTKCPEEGHTHKSTAVGLGTVPGSNGYTIDLSRDNSSDSSTYNTNPFAYMGGRSLAAPVNAKPGHNGGYFFFTLGYLHSVKDGLLRITTQNLKAGMTEEDERYFWAYYDAAIVPAKVKIVELTSTGDYTLTAATVDDIRTYEQVGSKCDLIFVNSRSGRVRDILIFRV